MQCHKPAVSLSCTAASTRRQCLLPQAGCITLVMGCCTPLHVQQISTGVTAVPQAFCQLVMYSSLDRRQCSLPQAVQWFTAVGSLPPLHVQQISIGMTALPQACCQLVMCSSFRQEAMQFATGSAVVHWCWVPGALACTADPERFDCSAASMLSACFVQQLQAGGNLFATSRL